VVIEKIPVGVKGQFLVIKEISSVYIVMCILALRLCIVMDAGRFILLTTAVAYRSYTNAVC